MRTKNKRRRDTQQALFKSITKQGQNGTVTKCPDAIAEWWFKKLHDLNKR